MAVSEHEEVLHDTSLPLPVRLDSARAALREFAAASAAIREVVFDAVRSEVHDDNLTATLYWEYEDLVPMALLGAYHELREMLESRCPWTYPCPSCGEDQPLTSRTALTAMRRAVERDDNGTLQSRRCAQCRQVEQESSDRAWREREATYRRRLHELKTMPYAEYLRTPEWQERRKARLKAAWYACQVCNARNTMLNVHHRTYERRGEEYARDLIVLCENCHHMFHRNGSLAPHSDGA